MHNSSLWPAPCAKHALDARCSLPGSKSESNRALVLAALADRPSKLRGVLAARDTDLMIAALAKLGIGVEYLAKSAASYDLLITPGFSEPAGQTVIDCGLAGTVMRFVPPLAALRGGDYLFTGDPRASQRPMAGLLQALTQLGVTCSADQLPVEISSPGNLAGGKITVDASATSQYISALLLAGAHFSDGLEISLASPNVPSLPHIQMSVKMLTDRGVKIETNNKDYWRVSPGAIQAIDQAIEPDLTNAATFLVAGVLSGGAVTVADWPNLTTQPGDQIRQVLQLTNASCQLTETGLTASYQGKLTAFNLDLHEASELAPVVAALAAFCSGTSTITGIGHIRGHETDRLAAITNELNSLGISCHELPDGLAINGCPLPEAKQLKPTRPLRSYADHRMAHFAALIGVVVPGIEIEDIAAVSKTMPDFTDRWAALLGQEAK